MPLVLLLSLGLVAWMFARPAAGSAGPPPDAPPPPPEGRPPTGQPPSHEPGVWASFYYVRIWQWARGRWQILHEAMGEPSVGVVAGLLRDADAIDRTRPPPYLYADEWMYSYETDTNQTTIGWEFVREHQNF